MEETVRDAGADNVIPYRTRRGALGKTAFDLSPKTSQQGGIESANYPWRTMTWSAQIVHYNRGAKFKKQDQNNSRRRHESVGAAAWSRANQSRRKLSKESRSSEEAHVGDAHHAAT
jgi:hypothetical protein